MDDDLRAAGERFVTACRKRDPDYESLDEDAIADFEGYLDCAIPEPWRAFLLEYGSGPRSVRYRWPNPNGELDMHPGNAAEHQVETDDGHAIAADGSHVLGYIEGIGDCVVLDGSGVVQHHDHSGDEEALGSLTELVGELARRLEQNDGVSTR